MGQTEQLARYIAETNFADFPPEVVEAAKVGLLDGISNVLAGSTQPVAQIMGQYVKDMGGTLSSTVIGWGFKTNPVFAAFANGTFLHCMDYEIQGQPASHGTSSIFPPALALAEQRGGASGRDLIEAYTIGWDVQQRIRAAGRRANLRGFHPPGVFGPMGAAAAGAKVYKFDTDQVRTTLGIAGSRTGGLFANNGTMVKSTHPGNAARMGAESVLLANAGFISNTDILEASQGYVAALFGDEFFDYDVLYDGMGTRFHLVDPGFNIKKYPAEIFMQWPIDAIATLRARHGFSQSDVEAVQMELPPMHHDLSRPRPVSGLDGKFSFEYCSIIALVDDPVGIDSFSDETCHSAPVQEALGKVSLVYNPEIPRDPQEIYVRATVTLKNGETLVETMRKYRGSIANPMNRDERIVKYEDCAKRVLAPNDMARLLDLVENLEQVDDIGELTQLLGKTPA